MKDLNIEQLEIRLGITDTAVDLYMEQGGTFTLSQVAGKLDLTVAEIFNYFPNKKAILKFYYTSLVIRYRLMIEEIEDFETYTLSEKLSNFIYASFDMMEEKRSFVEKTFHTMIRRSYSKPEYAKQVEKLFEGFFRNDPGVAASSTLVTNRTFFKLMRKKYFHLVDFWLDDDSEGKEVTMELTDKLTAFIQEVMYTKVLDLGFELLKFLISNNIVTQKIPFWDRITSKIEIR